MPTIANVCGLLLILTGVAGYFLADLDDRSLTAFIPSLVGILLLITGIWAGAAPNSRKHLMHAAAVIGLLGAILAGGRLGMVLATGGGSPLSIGAVTVMFAICLIFLILCVRSFRAARRNRASENG